MTTQPYIAQVVFQGKTGLAKDRFVNTFHFLGDGLVSTKSEILAIADRLANFYNGTGTNPSNAIAYYLSDVLDPHAHINIYRYADAKPRPPYISSFDLTPSSSRIPEQVALCLSFTSGRNVPRGRGRIYLGPLSSPALSAGVEVTSRPSPAFLEIIRMAADTLVKADTKPLEKHTSLKVVFSPDIPAFEIPDPFIPPISIDLVTTVKGTVQWAQYSHIGLGTMPTKKNPALPKNPLPVFEPVKNGWIDNEWDGVSRRRVGSSARVTF